MPVLLSLKKIRRNFAPVLFKWLLTLLGERNFLALFESSKRDQKQHVDVSDGWRICL